MDADILETRIANARASIRALFNTLRGEGDERNCAIAYAALEELAAFEPDVAWRDFLIEATSEVVWSVER